MPKIDRIPGIRARLPLMVSACTAAAVLVVLIAAREAGGERLAGAVWGAALTGAFATLVVWRGVEQLVVRRVRAMLAATTRLRAGDLTARTGLSGRATEMDALANEFDDMAAALQRQQQDRMRAEEQLRRSEARKSAVLQASLDGILVLNGQGSVLECNAAARAMFGCDGRQCVHHRMTDLFPHAMPVNLGRLESPSEVFESAGRRLDGGEFPVEMAIAPIRDESSHALFVATVHDITRRKQLERSLESLSFEDDLTGVYNRRGFLMFASQQMKLAARTGQAVVLVSVDLDGLKRINDHFGHANGDRALVELAAALRASFRETDVVGRMGGDEFVVLALESEQQGADQALERFAMRLAGRNSTGDLPWTLSAAVGWMRADAARGVSLGEMLASVDERMYEHKRRASQRRSPALPSLEPEDAGARFGTFGAPAAPAAPAPSEPAAFRAA